MTDLIKATPEEDVLRRDIYDRAPVLKWTQGRVALLGDSVHAMQPNLGQGGCMAIEDAYQLVTDLSNEVEAARDSGREINVEGVLVGYTLVRMLLTQKKIDACYPFSFLFGFANVIAVHPLAHDAPHLFCFASPSLPYRSAWGEPAPSMAWRVWQPLWHRPIRLTWVRAWVRSPGSRSSKSPTQVGWWVRES